MANDLQCIRILPHLEWYFYGHPSGEANDDTYMMVCAMVYIVERDILTQICNCSICMIVNKLLSLFWYHYFVVCCGHHWYFLSNVPHCLLLVRDNFLKWLLSSFNLYSDILKKYYIKTGNSSFSSGFVFSCNYPQADIKIMDFFPSNYCNIFRYIQIFCAPNMGFQLRSWLL